MDETQQQSSGPPEDRQRGTAIESGDASLWLAALVNSSDNAIISKTLDGIVMSWNAAAQHIYGYSSEEIVGKPISLLIPPDRLDEFDQIMRRLRRGERTGHFETVRVRRDGTRIDVSVTISPIVDARGQIIGASTIARDITGRKQAEIERERLLRELDKNRRLFQHIAETTPDVIYLIDLDTGNTAFINVRCEEVIGYTIDEVLALGNRFAVTLWHPNDVPGLPEHRRRLQELADAEIYECDYRVRQKDGTYRWLHSRNAVFAHDDGGQVRQIIGVTQDITERKRAAEALHASEKRFRSYFELGLIGMAITSPNKGILEVNDELCAIVGYERSELLQMTWADLTHPEDLAADATQFNRVVAAEIDGYSLDKRFIRKNSQIIDTSISVNCVRHADGSVDYFVALLQDITERRRAEAELLALKNRLAADLSAMTHLHELGSRLVATSEVQPLLQDALDTSIGFLGADFGTIQLYNPETSALEIAVQHGFDQAFLDYFSRVDDDHAACGRAVRYGDRVVIEDVELDAGFAPHRAIAAASGFRAVQSTPLRNYAGELLGMFSTYFRQPHQFTERELRLTDLYARQATEMISFTLGQERLGRAHDELETKVAERTHELRMFASLIENSLDFVGIASPEGQVLFVNLAGQEMVGLDGDAQARATKILDYVAEHEQERVQNDLLPAVVQAGRWEGEIVFRHFKTGAQIPIWLHLFFISESGNSRRIALAVIGRDITERRRAEQDRRRVMEQLVNAQEEERRRIARELHDSLGQHLTALHLGLKSAQAQENAPPNIADILHQLRELALRIDDEIDHIAFELRPPSLDDLGLAAALGLLIKEWSATSSIHVDWHTGQLDHWRLPPAVETTVYRIVQEALTNIHKHAQATHVSLIVERRDAEVRAIIEDNGQGFDIESMAQAPNTGRKLGLRGMEERAALAGGWLDVEAAPGAGTTVYLRIPIPAGAGDGGSTADG